MQNNKLLFALFTLAAFSGKIAAADYAAAVSVDANAVHDDNFRLTQDDKVVIYGATVAPKFLFDASTENSRWNVDTTLRSARYNETDYNTNDQFFSAGYTQKFERSSVGLNADIVNDSTNTSETASSGRVGNKAERHEHYALSPSWNYALTENNSVGIDGTYSRDNYAGQGYIGYDNWDANANWNYTFNERLSFLTRLSYTDYRSEDISAEVPYYVYVGPPFDQYLQAGLVEQSTTTKQTSKSLLLGFQYLWTEQQSLTVLIGRSRQQTDYQLTDPLGTCSTQGITTPLCLRENQSGNGLTADIKWNWRNERNQFDLGLTQSTQPTSDAQAVEQLQLSGNWRYALSELQSLRFSLQGYRNSDLNNTARKAYLNRDYVSSALEYNYQLTENWLATGSYQYRFQDYTEQNNIARGQIITLGVRYQPTQWHWSR